MSDITSMMIASDNRTLDLPSLNATDATAFQISYNLKHLPDNIQPVLISDSDKSSAFLATFFTKAIHPQEFDFCYAYTLQQPEQPAVTVTILTHTPPTSAEDFFALALAINNQSLYQNYNVIVADLLGKPVTEHTRKMFIYSLLQEAALCGHAPATKALANLQQDAKANNYLCQSRFDFIYNYKNTNKFILLPSSPATPEEFFALANDIELSAKLMVFAHHKIIPHQNSHVNELLYSLLSDAAKAGHDEAQQQLIEATIAGCAAARKFVTFARYNAELPILLPRQFISSADFYKLSTSLITHGKHIMSNSCSLEGPFYIVQDGRQAERLGYLLRNRADSLKRAEEEMRVSLAKSMQVEEFKTLECEQAEVVSSAQASADLSNLWYSMQPNNPSAFFFSEGKAATALLDIQADDSPALGIKSR